MAMEMEGRLRRLVLCLFIPAQTIMLVAAMAAAAAGSQVQRRPAAMFVFGDSLVDVGNNNYLPGANVPRANRPYYGVDFPGGVPTGRFSNGYNTADFIAMSMGFESSPPAYLSLSPNSNLVPTALTTGVSYASADAGILDSTHAGKCIPLSTQVQYFKATKALMVASVGAGKVNKLLADSIILVCIGSNDMFMFAAGEQSRKRSAAALYADLLSNYSATITELHSMGARKFAVINVGLLGCVPTVRVLNAAGACDEGLNQLAAGFDVELGPLLAGHAARLPGLVFSLADSFRISRETFANQAAAGYTDVSAACCGSGRLLAEADCMPNSTVCTDHDAHVFWDRFHPTQRACRLSAQAFYDGPPQYTTPINFKQLAKIVPLL